MSYGSFGARPVEFASKSSHFNIEDTLREHLKKCSIAYKVPIPDIMKQNLYDFTPVPHKIENIISIDSGIAELHLEDLPTVKLFVIQFGIVSIKLSDLRRLSQNTHISPKDLKELKQVATSTCIVPASFIKYHNCSSVTHSIRYAFYDYYTNVEPMLGDMLMELLYATYKENPYNSRNLSSHPTNGKHNIQIERRLFEEGNYKTIIDNEEIYITDMFRLHELMSEEQGITREGISQFVTATEHILMLSLIKFFKEKDPNMLKNTLFILDRPLSFYGQVSNFQQNVREYLEHLRDQQIFPYILGIEKTGHFVDHAQILKRKELIKPGQVLLLSNEYIQSYIIPQKKQQALYGQKIYYGGKVIYYSSSSKDIYVCSVPTYDYNVVEDPKIEDYLNLEEILSVVDDLACYFYDNALLPIVLVNQSVSISRNPGAVSLSRIAKDILSL